MTRSYALILLCMTLIFQQGCYVLVPRPDPALASAADLLHDRKYDEALAGYRSLAAVSKSPRSRAEARYAIGVILAAYDNPKRNFAQALEAFEEFLRNHPHDERALEALNWKNALLELQSKKQENEQLKKNIEELKRLDIRHEKKRGLR